MQPSALPAGTVLAGDYEIERVLGAGGFGVTYLAREPALSRKVSIKEYFPSDFASRDDAKAVPRSRDCAADYKWGLDRFVEEAQTLAKFNHANIVKVHRTFQANNTAYMVLHFEEGQSFKTWLKNLKRAPRQKELDQFLTQLLDALETIHAADFLHRDIAPDNIIIRTTGGPVLIDFGSARSDIAAHSKTKTVSALVKPGYSPYEQYAETSRQQGPWTDIYALAATLYHAVTGKRPPDSPSRMLNDELVPAREAARGDYRGTFLDAIQRGLALNIDARPQSIREWRGALLAPEPEKPGFFARLKDQNEGRARKAKDNDKLKPEEPTHAPPPPDAPGPQGGLLDFVDSLKKPAKPPEKDKAKEKAKANAPLAPPATAMMAAKLAPQLPPAPPPPKTSRKKRARPTPDVKRKSWFARVPRGLKARLAIAAVVAGGMFAFQDQLARVLSGPGAGGVTTGTVARRTEPERAIAEGSSFKAHDFKIDHLRLSGDGRLIVSVGNEGQMRIWDAASKRQLGAINLEGGPATSLSVRNNRAATAHAGGTVAVYDLDTQRRLYKFKRNDASVWATAFAGSEDRITAGSHDGTIAIWESASETAPASILEGHENAVQALAADQPGRWLASAGAGKTVKIWNLETREATRTLRNHSDFLSALAFSPDGSQVAAGSIDGTVKLWSVANGRVQKTINQHAARIALLAFSPSGELLASAAEDGTVRVRGVGRSRVFWSIGGLDRRAKTLAFTNDGRTLLTGGDDGVVRYWPLPEPQVAQQN